MRVAVAGATGMVGRHVVDVLRARHDVVPISRSGGVDVITGHGLDEALAGVECVVDCATGPSADQRAATEFFTTAAGNLLQAGARAGLQRMVVVSIVGCDRYTAGYLAANAAHEQAMLAGPVPAQVLRAAQFHELVGRFVRWRRRGDVTYLPKMRTQPVAARTAAEALAELATNPAAPPAPGEPVPEIAGPQPEDLAELARLLVARRGGQLRVEEVSDHANPDRERNETGGLLPGPHATLAGPTFQEWLGGAS